MISKAIGRIWNSIFGAKTGLTTPGFPATETATVVPFTTGIWIDAPEANGSGAEKTRSEILWLCTDEEGRLAKGLRVSLLTN